MSEFDKIYPVKYECILCKQRSNSNKYCWICRNRISRNVCISCGIYVKNPSVRRSYTICNFCIPYWEERAAHKRQHFPVRANLRFKICLYCGRFFKGEGTRCELCKTTWK